MDGVLGRLRDVGKTVTGVLGARLTEGRDEPDDPEAGPDTVDEPVAAANDAADDEADVDGADPAPSTLPEVPVEPTAGPGAGEPTAVEPAVIAEAPQPLEPQQPVEPDALLAAAVDLARAAAVEVAGTAVGDHLGVEADSPPDLGPVVTHSFATLDPAYVGWRWAVTVARATGSDTVTVDEVVLLPGAGALLAPAWLPWNERLEPGDLSVGDLLPPPPDDERLVPAYADPEAELADEVGAELGLGRPRVLSVEGRAMAAERWYEGPGGPDSAIARQAPGRCADCGFLVLLVGSLRGAFGVCANGYAPDDGRVVALSHGCGAHSETVVEAAHAATSGMAVEHDELELLPVGESDPA